MSKCDTGYIYEAKVASLLDQKAFIFKSAWISGFIQARVADAAYRRKLLT
jgi:hypothetical protein